ncbi:hypothetical protein EHW97_04660 [Aeromicrobium camelliae]|uniref:Glycosyl hydrolase family 95 catalytic domain-containing protein n=1 Tax=Aeromicrobium camelliae TaxID=1538144 RepID=A0A3N6X5S1_9ACTN|nr:hypothetical protein [Aeromicrobium camelliae]RQN08993.1 hypothetical protein EHW97_04660 [Aeromicrobium camelliae]
MWSQDGFTAQLNRGDVYPDMQSAGQLVIPGLFTMAEADDYSGRLSMHDATLTQSGAGITARTWMPAGSEQLIVEVSGVDPRETQEVMLRLWDGRFPQAVARGNVAALAETFQDERNGRVTGQVAAVKADARDPRATVVDDREVKLEFCPRQDGTFRLVVGIPSWDGSKLERTLAHAVQERGNPRQAHEKWWRDFWQNAAPMRWDSEDGTARYFETLRVQQLYMGASSQRAAVPTSHGGVTSIFSSTRDSIHWSADSWWHFNLRQPVWTNFGAGTAELNESYVNLYLDRLEDMEAWTRQHWPAAEGICVPEFLRYDGTAEACRADDEPSHVNRILSTGAEVSHNLWLQYRHTGDEKLLKRSYPLMAQVARFYLSVLEPDADGILHLHHANALEVQWDTTDPTPDVAGMRTMFPIVADLAQKYGDHDLARQLHDAIEKLPELPTTERNGQQVIAWSATDEPAHNTQNPDLEAVWPWGVAGAADEIAHATFENRVHDQTREWASDAQWAARLGRADDMRELLVRGTTDFQAFANGFSAHNRRADPLRGGEFYDGWNAVVASTLQDALVREDDGTITVAGSLPQDWDVTGAVEVPGGHRISVEAHDGRATLVGIEAGSSEKVTLANPWPGEEIQLTDGRGRRVLAETTGPSLELQAKEGQSYVVQRSSAPLSQFRFAALGGAKAEQVQHLGNRSYGVDSGVPQIMSDVVRVLQPWDVRPLLRAANGALTYTDRSYTITSLPEALEGSALIRGINGDGKVTSADYLSLQIERPATVFVAFAANGEGVWWPAWLETDGWQRTGDVVATTDRPMVVFRKDVEPGRVTLGGNSGVEGQGGSSYITFVSARD